MAPVLLHKQPTIGAAEPLTILTRAESFGVLKIQAISWLVLQVCKPIQRQWLARPMMCSTKLKGKDPPLATPYRCLMEPTISEFGIQSLDTPRQAIAISASLLRELLELMALIRGRQLVVQHHSVVGMVIGISLRQPPR